MSVCKNEEVLTSDIAWTIYYKQTITPLYNYADLGIDSTTRYHIDILSTLYEEVVKLIDLITVGRWM